MILYSMLSSGFSAPMGIYLFPANPIRITGLPTLWPISILISVSSENPFRIISLNSASKTMMFSETICLLRPFLCRNSSIKLAAFS